MTTGEVPQQPQSPLLSVSIVVFASDMPLLGRCLDALDLAVNTLQGQRPEADCEVWLVDNGPPDYSCELAAWLAQRRSSGRPTPALLSGHGNVGYGRANNLVIANVRSRFHLVLNPDAEVEPEALLNGVDYLTQHADTGLVAATAVGPQGQALRLCKNYPTVLVLALRALPIVLGRGPLARLRARYDLIPAPQGPTDVTGAMVSGSFMLCRTNLLQAVGGFDPRYFLFFEDFDLALRISRRTRAVWLPDVRMLHHGGQAARKGWAHRRMFARSAARFFGGHGWRWW